MEDVSQNLPKKLEYGVSRRPEFGPIWLDIRSRTLQMAGTDRYETLTETQYQILWVLVRAQGAIINQSEIRAFLDISKPEEADIPLSNVIEVQVGQIRKKLTRLTGGRVRIKTSNGQGWSIEEVAQK